MDTSTQQFAFKWFVRTVCLLIGGMFLYMAAVGLLQGDGEAVKIIDSLAPMMRDTLIALVAMVTGAHAGQVVNTIMGAKVQTAQTAVQAVQAVAQTQQPAEPAKAAESEQPVG